MEKTKMFTLAGRIVGNLFKKPATTQYPFEPVEFPERMRGHISIRIEDCITCGLCARACPSLAIQVDGKAGTWTISRFDCVQCGSCVLACPKKCLTMEKGYTEPDIMKKSDTVVKPQEAKVEAAGDSAAAAKQLGFADKISHIKAAELDLEFGASITDVPYNEGAARYFEEQGFTVPTA